MRRISLSSSYGNVFVTAPSPENLKTLFEFVFKGLEALGYAEHLDYDIVQSTHADFNRAVVRVNIFKNSHRQTILYIQPQDANLLSQAELIVIDEAAAIPLPLVQTLCSGPQLAFMASTINGYEGTGRSLSLKLIQQLRTQGGAKAGVGSRGLCELTLNEPIRYGSNDPVEKWLNNLLCLDVASITAKTTLAGLFPNPEACELYAVNRDTLFSYHKASEAFLQKMMGLYVASHYKNTPNDLQLMSDAPAHRLYVLLPPVDERNATTLPEILCVLQVCFEGEISKQVVMQSLARGKRAGGDLIPWTISQQFQDDDFATLSGARVVRVAVHPELQGMGYGSRAIQILEAYFSGKLFTGDESDPNALDEDDENRLVNMAGAETAGGLQSEIIKPRTNLKPLLVKLSDRQPVLLDWLGVSFGMTQQLFKFWRRLDYLPVYLRQTTNGITGEHTAVMLKRLGGVSSEKWLEEFNEDFRRRFVSLLGYQFRSFQASLALDILTGSSTPSKSMTGVQDAAQQISLYDLKRLESYANNMVDYHMIVDMAPTMARHYFLGIFKADFSLSPVQAAIVLTLGLQHRTIEELERELKLPVSQLLAMFIKAARKFSRVYRDAHLSHIESTARSRGQETTADGAAAEKDSQRAGTNKRLIEDAANWQATAQRLGEDLEEAAQESRDTLREKQRELINALDLQAFAITGDDEEWEREIKKKEKNLAGSVLNIGKGTTAAAAGAAKKKSLAETLFKHKDVEIQKKAKKSKYASRS